jgi:hypothetical protein
MVAVSGSLSSAGLFWDTTLTPRYVIIFNNRGRADANGHDWYLRSVDPIRGGPVPAASVQTALPYADVLSNYAEATLGTLQKRTGNRMWPNGLPPEIIWCKDPAARIRRRVSVAPLPPTRLVSMLMAAR